MSYQIDHGIKPVYASGAAGVGPAHCTAAAVSISGPTVIWAPAGTETFRLLGGRVQLASNSIQSSSAALVAVKLYEGSAAGALSDATAIPGLAWFVPVPTATGAPVTGGQGWNSGWFNLGNGYKTGAAGNKLYLYLGAPLTGGGASAMVVGRAE